MPSATPLIPSGRLPPPQSGTYLSDELEAQGHNGVTDAEARIFDPEYRENPARRTYQGVDWSAASSNNV
jgi:hypothetical protein